MPDLSPAPSSLGLASPVLGPWFETSTADESDLADLAPPDADLGCPLSIPNQGIWNAPASGVLSYHIASASRPAPLAVLRQADGTPAFSDGALVLLFTLLPEVAQRLGALSHAAPRPDSTTPAAAGQATRPVIDRFALEIPAGSVDSVAELIKILPDKDSADLHDIANGLSSDAEKAGYVGLGVSGGLTNAQTPTSILRRPEKDDRRLLENQSGSPLAVKLWAFDVQGRPFDAGAVAAIWAHLAGPTVWTNLWASDSSTRQRTTSVAAGRIVHLVNAHEGPLEGTIKSRISGQLTDLTAVGGSDVVFTAGANPAIALTAASDANTDTAPLPRIAPLPTGPYAAPDSATPFAGWSASTALARDFLRVAITDVERHCIGLGRDADSAQAEERLRVSPARNTADTVFLPTSDAVATEVMARLQDSGATVQMIAPELDRFWGPQTPATITGGDPFGDAYDALAFSVHALKGSGSTVGGTAEAQSVVLHFAESLPAGAWVRAWPHGRDTTTGRRFRMDGGAALVDGAGNAVIALPLPNGTNGDGTDAVQFSFDMLLTTDQGRRLYTDLRANRPAVVSTGAVAITGLTGSQSLYLPQVAMTVDAGVGAIPPGAPVIVMNGAMDAHDYAALDISSLRASDLANTLIGLADGSDTVVTRDPAFVQTTPGDLPTTQQPGGPVRVHDSDFHKPATGQEMYDFAAYDTTGNRGVIGALPARAPWHEAPPAAGAHAGVSAAPEIHAEGVAVAGPAADALRLLMRERTPADIQTFVQNMGVPFTPATAPTDAGPWTALLETAARGTHGHMLMSLIPSSFDPGETWDDIKTKINDVISSLPGSPIVEDWINTASFDEAVAAAAFDRVLHKHRKGVQGFARAALAAIGRAEDLVWLQSPALDDETFTDSAAGDIHLLQALTDRMAANLALRAILILPEKHLPDRNARLDQVRKSAIGGALLTLQSAAGDRVAWIAPNAGPGRPYHMAATTLIVDDAIMLTGGAHAWRRGLVFDSALSASLFDERLTAGRPRVIVTARRLLSAAILGIDEEYLPISAADLIAQARAVNVGGGFQRADPAAHKVRVDTTSPAEKEIWNPAISASTDWTASLAGLTGDIKTEFENGTR